MDKQFESGLVWFRRDLRVQDHAALSLALQSCRRVYCAFVFDQDILSPLPRTDRRVAFIHASLYELDADLRRLGPSPDAGLIVRHGRACVELPQLAAELQVDAVFIAHDYEPQAQVRDGLVRTALTGAGIRLHTCKDHVVFEGRELLTQAGNPYSVFTPYKNQWLAKIGDALLRPFEVASLASALAPCPPSHRQPIPSLGDLGFSQDPTQGLKLPVGATGAHQLLDDFLARIDDYQATRDFPAVKGPSYLSVHLRFGTVSIRHVVALARARQLAGSAGAACWLGELIWRDFYFQILANFPHVAEGAFKPAYDAIHWVQGAQAESLFAAWCQGQTGYPLVDAAMAQLNQTGYMHNRLRMVTGSFLVKDLGVDWRWGEAYFARQLNDFDLAANNGGWQWVSSSGCDAQPYFRIFNPIRQSQNFDPQGKFIRRYLPQLAALATRDLHAPWLAPGLTLAGAGVELGRDYPRPVVDHDQARRDTLARYAVVDSKRLA